MKKLSGKITFFLCIFGILNTLMAQSLERQYQEADAELNKVYKELRSHLNEQQKAELKKSQLDWIKRRDAFANNNPGQRQAALYQSTVQRVEELKKFLVKMDAPIQALELKMDSGAAGAKDTSRSSPEIKPVPQLPHNAPLSCASVSVDNQFLVTGDSSGIVKVWNIKTGDLVKSLQVGSHIVAARLSPDLQSLYLISKERRENPFLHRYETITWLPSSKVALLTTYDRAGEAFISRDCSYVVITGDTQLERGDADVFSIESQNSQLSSKLNPIRQARVTQLFQLFPELQKTSNCFDQFGVFFGGTRKSCVYKDGAFSLEQGKGLEWILKRNDEQLVASSNRDAFACLGLSLKYPRLLAYGESELRTLDLETLSYSRCLSPGGAIRAAACSPTDERLAVVTQLRKDIIQAAVLTRDGLTLEKKEISSSLPRTTTFDGSERTYSIDGIAWIKDSIFLTSGEALTCFTDKWDLAKRYESAAVCEISRGEAVVVSPIRGQIKQDAPDFFERVSVRNYLDGYERSVLAYSCEAPTCMRFYPFDISQKADRIAKAFWWRGGGGLFVGNANSVTHLDTAINDRAPDACAFVGENLFVSGVSEDGRESVLMLLDSSRNYRARSDISVPKITGVKVDKQSEVFVGVEGDAMVACYRIEAGGLAPLVRVMFGDGGFTIFTSDLHYLATGKAPKFLRFGKALQVYPFEQFDLRLNRPDIVLERLGAPSEAIAIAKQLREKRLKRMGVTEDMLQPDFHLPEIEIVGDLPSSTAESELTLKTKATDSKYPLDRLRVYVNNVPVNGKEGELLRDSKSQALERTIPIKLAAGRNKIQVSVINSAGAESLYANAEVTCTAQRPKPTLYAVAMGVSEYANPDWNLKYAAKDARDILERVKARSGSSYGEIKELLLTDREATKESLGKIRDFLSGATVDDTVLLFVAGHGLLDTKYDYYFGTADIDFNNPSGKGIAFEEFDDLLADLPCLRKSLLVDTCHAGELDEDEKKNLASAAGLPAPLPLVQGVAMRSVGKRGMTIKPTEGARGKSEWYDRLQGLFVDLRRGSGSTILSSSAGAEYALESSEQKNGLFTYAVLEALDGKEGTDANKDGSVTMSELADYVKTRVAALTNNKQSPNVRRVNLESDFALSDAIR